MPPPIALCVYSAFIFWLFRRYVKEAGPMTWRLWVPLIWITINASRPLAYWFSSGTSAAEVDVSGGSFYDRNAYLLLMGLGIMILAQRKVAWPGILNNSRWLFILFAYYLVSVAWSSDPFVSFKRWFKASGDIVMAFILVTETNPVEAVRAVFIRSYYILIPLSVVAIKYYKDIGRYYGKWEWETHYCGLTGNKNNLGQLALLASFFLMWQMVDIYRKRGQQMSLRAIWPDLIVLGMCLWLQHLAHSSTALVCMIVGTAIFFGSRLRWVRANLQNLGWCVLGLGLFMAIFTLSSQFRGTLAGMVGRDATLTDRTLIWDKVLDSGSNPIIGEGFDGYWMSGKGDEVIDEFHVYYAHNGYLDQYLDVGIIGILLFAGMIYTAGRNATSHFVGDSPVGHLFPCLFWTCLLFNYTEISFGRSNVFGFLILLIVAFGAYSPPMSGNETVVGEIQGAGANVREVAIY